MSGYGSSYEFGDQFFGDEDSFWEYFEKISEIAKKVKRHYYTIIDNKVGIETTFIPTIGLMTIIFSPVESFVQKLLIDSLDDTDISLVAVETYGKGEFEQEDIKRKHYEWVEVFLSGQRDFVNTIALQDLSGNSIEVGDKVHFEVGDIDETNVQDFNLPD